MSDVWNRSVVVARQAVGTKIVVLDLAPDDGGRFAKFDAGAHIDVRVGSNHMVRQYSLCPSQEGQYRIAVLRSDHSRGGSEAMHNLAVGNHLHVSEPRLLFGLADADRHILLGAGIGITPLLSMVEKLEATTDSDYRLHYIIRSPTEAAFLPELRVNPRVTVHVTGGTPPQRPKPAVLLGEPASATAVYVCGPSSFMEAVLCTATEMGWPPSSIHTERFTPPVATSGRASESEFKVRVASTGAMYVVPAERSVLEVLRANSIGVSFSCQQGICGECVVKVLSGDPDHRDDVLDDDERAQGAFALCVSRSREAILELDI